MGLVRNTGTGATMVAFPYLVAERIEAVAALRLPRILPGRERQVLLQMQLAGGWLMRTGAARADCSSATTANGQMLDPLWEIVTNTVAAPGFLPACRSLATGLALATGSDRVSLIWFRGTKPRLVALSNASEINRKLALAHALCEAAAEATDQYAILAYPVEASGPALVTRAVEDLARRFGVSAIVAVPALYNGKPLFAIVAERSANSGADERNSTGFEPSSISRISAATTVLAPVLHTKHQADAPLWRVAGRRFLGALSALVGQDRIKLKLATLAIILAAATVSLVRGSYEIVADARLEGKEVRWIVAPFDGYLASAPARPGMEVTSGDILLAFDTRELELARLGHISELRQHQIAADVATAKADRSQFIQLRAEMEHDQANIDLLDANLARAVVRAPFNALVISGDLGDKLGAPVNKGDRLLSLSPKGELRVEMFVRDSAIEEIATGQEGVLRLTALPGQGLKVTVVSITPVTEIENGENVFRVEAALVSPPNDLRPGMKGVVRLAVDERSLLAIWSQPVVDWLRLAIWKWKP
jgi:multidrug resistance efflux pump